MKLRSGAKTSQKPLTKSVSNKLKSKYYNAKIPGSFAGAYSFSKVLKTSKRQMQSWLQSQDTYSLHGPVIRKFPRRKVICNSQYAQLECDLIDMQNLSRWNNGVRYLLSCIDCFSKKAFVRPQRNKKTTTTITALADVLNEIKVQVTKISADDGSEFKSKAMDAFLNKRGIHLFSTKNKQLKSVIIERYNRTLENRLYRYMTSKSSKRYIDILQDIVSSYNKTYHSSIGMAPENVNSTNSEDVWNRLYRPPAHRKSKPRYHVGSFVRVQKKQKMFTKGYLQGWEPDIYTVINIHETTPYTYTIMTAAGRQLRKTYYERELTEISQ